MDTPATQGLTPAVRAELEALGIPVKAWDPRQLKAVVKGHKTLGELVNISKERQLEVAAMGLTLLKDGLRDKAKLVFEGLEALDPYDAYVQTCLGAIAAEEGQADAAAARFDRALSLNPTSAPALLSRGELRARQGRKAEALKDLEAAARSTVPGNQDVVARARAMLEALRKVA